MNKRATTDTIRDNRIFGIFVTTNGSQFGSVVNAYYRRNLVEGGKFTGLMEGGKFTGLIKDLRRK